jgi:hypothetical protein
MKVHVLEEVGSRTTMCGEELADPRPAARDSFRLPAVGSCTECREETLARGTRTQQRMISFNAEFEVHRPEMLWLEEQLLRKAATEIAESPEELPAARLLEQLAEETEQTAARGAASLLRLYWDDIEEDERRMTVLAEGLGPPKLTHRVAAVLRELLDSSDVRLDGDTVEIAAFEVLGHRHEHVTLAQLHFYDACCRRALPGRLEEIRRLLRAAVIATMARQAAKVS